jgi:hypothetical protein
MAPTKRPVERTPWAEAIAQIPEAELRLDEHGRPYSHQRVSNWRRDGVPAQIMLAKERARTRGHAGTGSSSAEFAAAMDAVRTGIWQIWSATGGEGTPKWESVEALLAAIVRMMSKDRPRGSGP